MTKLEEVLAEEWTLSTDQGDEGDIFDAAKPREPYVMSAMGHESMLVPRARVAILGKRALALVLKHEWSGGDVAGNAICPECAADGKLHPDPNIDGRYGTHKPGCEWGAIVKAAKEVG